MGGLNSGFCCFAALLAVVFAPALPGRAYADDAAPIAEIVVTSQRRAEPRLSHTGNIGQLGADEISWVQHQHISELLGRVAGTWIVRGSGQDHQTAIRSPVLGGGGSCGGFLILEDGIPVRPAGFCNTNQLIEVNAEQAHAVEVIRGPGTALFGSNSMHGIVNVLMPDAFDHTGAYTGIELGSNDFVRARMTLPFGPDAPWFAAFNLASDSGFRSASGYRQGKLHVKRGWSFDNDSFALALSATDLDQETAGFINGHNAFESKSLSTTNPNPEAFRDASSLRLYGLWNRAGERADIDVRPYMRRSSMRFMHHALPGQPIERNGQVSAGVITTLTVQRPNWQTLFGVDLEWSDVYLEQTQFEPATGSPQQRETRPVGKHYDYVVEALLAAPFLQLEHRINGNWTIGGGIRFEYAHYNYDNRMLSGNTRDDGSICGFDGCLYSRPEDRKDSFANTVANLSARYRLSERSVLFGGIARGFRAPQMLELYRLQNGQQIADLESEHVDSLEIGVRTTRDKIVAEVVAFAMQKRDGVFRDAEGFNVTGARSRHKGIEADVDIMLARHWLLGANISYATHTYDFTASGRGASFVKGNAIDTAPRWLGNIELAYEPTRKLRLGLQVTGVGDYYLDPGNEHRYSGHTLANLRVAFRPDSRYTLNLRVNNLLDTRYADRADFAGRNYRYLPGRGREAFLEVVFNRPGSARQTTPE
jgi:outer membrane receptor protein involved in Fe transport